MSSPRLSFLDLLIQKEGHHHPTKHPGSQSHRRTMGSAKQRRRDLRLRRRSALRARVATAHPERIEDEA